MGGNSNSNCSAKVATVSDLLQRAAASCLSQRFLPGTRALDEDGWSSEEEALNWNENERNVRERDSNEREDSIARAIAREKDEEEEEEEKRLRLWEEDKDKDQDQDKNPLLSSTTSDQQDLKKLEALLAQVFDSVSSVKRAYRTLQQAHCPWDPHKMHAADAGVVSELRKLERLRNRFRRGRGRETGPVAAPSLSEAVAPYEAALDDLKKQLKVKEAEAENLRQKLRNSEASFCRKGQGQWRSTHSNRWTKGGPPLGGGGGGGVQATPIPHLFEVCMHQVKSASKSFASQLLVLMRAARWDIPAALQTLIPGAAVGSASNLLSQHPKYALESYINSRLFHGFEHESFYMDGSLASLIDPAAFRRNCFSQFCDMRTMDPTEMLGVLPTCQFGRFAATKYLSLVHEKMEESLFGHKEQRQQVVAGTHPRTEFYAEFLHMAKAVWMLHLLAFALDPAPTHFEVRKGAEFQPEFMESVVRFPSGRVPAGSVVAFSVAPGFRLSNGSVVRARVYLNPGNPGQ
ncbi:IRK-interacting protein [Carex littledalei]|uniref:IRK-interacting protein n=1 Tax=Carex littledalei TaxID=544730 RepID=A0A833VV86_9POAL|nr:IRK-interacting protein [Carex littledalei]